MLIRFRATCQCNMWYSMAWISMHEASMVPLSRLRSETTRDQQYYNVTWHQCGVLFDTYVIPAGQGLAGLVARETVYARYLHPFYTHLGGVTIAGCESYQNAGVGLSPSYDSVEVSGCYVHDNGFIGFQGSGSNVHV